MNITRRILQGIVSLAALAAIAAGRDEVVLTDHHLLDGKVVASTPSSVTLSHKAGGEVVQTVIPVDHIEPYSFYVIRSQAIGDDAAAHMELANFCLDHGLYPRARKQFETAASLDPSMKKAADAGVAKSREGSGADLLAKAQAEQQAGKANEAMGTLSEAVCFYGNTSAGDAARAQAGELHQQMMTQRAAKRAAQDAKQATGDLKRVQADLDRAAGHNKDGLQATEQSQALEAFQKAMSGYKRALSELGELAKKFKDDPQIVATIQGEVTQTQKDVIGVHMNMGAIYVTRSSYQQALDQANQSLAIDPQSSRAIAFRQRVESCSSQGITIL